MTEIEDIDVFVSGGGVAGLTATIAFAQAGFRTVCADPAPPITERDTEGADLRTTAFLQPAQAFLDRIGLWDRLSDHAMPLQVMRIVDAGGERPEPRVAHDFNAADISDKPFGWNLPNWLLRREMVAQLATLLHADFRPGVGTANVLTRETEAHVTLSDGARLRARLVIAADGRGSAVREGAGIDVRTTRYGQKALAFAVTHPIPHDNVSTEIHRSGGPFTLVPLPDYTGEDGIARPSSAVVWMERGPEVRRLLDLDTEAFEAAMTERSAHLFGPLTLVSRKTVWPIISQTARALQAERIALVAEAAHVVPPIGAQGLNMSLADIRTLLDLAEGAREDPGARPLLQRYARARHADILARVTGIDALNRASMVDAQGLRDMRMRALDAIYRVAPVRRVLMQTGLGARG
jgi:2-octaprenyl-6-methoxyphenol hydroxylase